MLRGHGAVAEKDGVGKMRRRKRKGKKLKRSDIEVLDGERVEMVGES